MSTTGSQDSQFNQNGIDTAVTASTDSAQASQGDSDEITTGTVVVATVGTSGDSLTLPYGAPAGARVTVKNQSATPMDVFPPLGDTINGGSANAALAITNDISVTFALDETRTNWEVVSNSDDSP